MTLMFKPAVRENTSVLVALAGSSGSGKTFSALRLARGLVGPEGKIALIDTEARRALHYAEKFTFAHGDMAPPFSPEAYAEAIAAAEKAGYGAIIIDSMSHEWAGDGGCQDMHDVTHERLGNSEQTNVLAWKDAKMAHKRMVSRLLQCRAHLIFCLRAEEKIKFQKDDRGKTQIVAAGWQPICEKNFMYEMTVSFMLHDEKPGIGVPIKLQEQHRVCFPDGKLIDESAGARLAEWAKGGVNPATGELPPVASPAAQQAQEPGWDNTPSLGQLMKGAGLTMPQLSLYMGVTLTRENTQAAVDQWLADHPTEDRASLVDMAAAERDAQVTARSQPEQEAFV